MSTTRVHLFGRASFLRVDRPERFQGTGEPKYSGNVIIEPKGEDFKKALRGMKAAAALKWGEDKAEDIVKKLMANQKVALVDGNTKDADGYEGMWVVQANAPANTPPLLVETVNGVNVKLDNETQNRIYSGCSANFLVDFWAQDNKWGRRINAQLLGIQFVKDGDPFSGSRPAGADDFDIAEPADDAGFDGDTGGDDDDLFG